MRKHINLKVFEKEETDQKLRKRSKNIGNPLKNIGKSLENIGKSLENI